MEYLLIIHTISCDIMLSLPAHTVVHFTIYIYIYIYDKYTVYRRIVNTPATAKIAIGDENKQADRFPFFSASQKTPKFNLIR